SIPPGDGSNRGPAVRLRGWSAARRNSRFLFPNEATLVERYSWVNAGLRSWFCVVYRKNDLGQRFEREWPQVQSRNVAAVLDGPVRAYDRAQRHNPIPCTD